MLYIYFFTLDLIVFLWYTYIRKVKDNTTNQKGLKMAAHIAFDTEATSLVKPFCYDIGYTIINDDGELESWCDHCGLNPNREDE